MCKNYLSGEKTPFLQKVYYMVWFTQEWGMIMKLPMIAGVIVFAFATEGAMAACASPYAKVTGKSTIENSLSGNIFCAARGGERWQEAHIAGGVLQDYKKGSTDAVDPTKVVGSWSVSGNIVTHNYTVGTKTGPSYTFELWRDGTSNRYAFCGASTSPGTNTDGILLTGAGPCL